MQHSSEDFSKKNIIADIDAISSLPSVESLDDDPETQAFLADMDQNKMVILPIDQSRIEHDVASTTQDISPTNSSQEPQTKRKAA